MPAFTTFMGPNRPIYGEPEMTVYFRHLSGSSWEATDARVLEVKLGAYEDGGSTARIDLPLNDIGYFDGYGNVPYRVEMWDEVLIEVPFSPWTYDGKIVLFRGYVTNLTEQFDGKSQSIGMFCQGPEYLYTGWTCLGRHYPGRELASARTTFNANGAPNFNGIAASSYPSDSLGAFGDRCEFLGRDDPYLSESATLAYWNQAEMLAYVYGRFASPTLRDNTLTYARVASMMTDGHPSQMPDIASRAIADAYPEVAIMGMNVADAISAIISTVPNTRLRWWLAPDGTMQIFNVLTVEPSAYSGDAAKRKSVFLPLPGNNLNNLPGNEELVSRARINVDGSRRFNVVDAYGGPKVFQTMITLDKGWDTSLESAVSGQPEKMDRSKDTWDPTYKDVGRRYVIGRATVYETGTPSVPLFSVYGEDCFAAEPRVLLPQLISTFTPTGEDRKVRHAVLVQRYKSGSWESIGGHIDPLFDETGIFFQSNPIVDVPGSTVGNWDGATTWYSLRITFAIEADDLLYQAGGSSKPLGNLIRYRAVDYGSDFKFHKIQHKASYPQPKVEQPGVGEVTQSDTILVDDSDRLEVEADWMADRLNTNERSVSMQIAHFSTTYSPGDYIDYIDRPDELLNPDGTGDVTIGATMVGVRWLFDGDLTTELIIADMRNAEVG